MSDTDTTPASSPGARGEDNSQTFHPDATPTTALDAIDEIAKAAGGAYMQPEEFTGSVGRTMFDVPSSSDGTITVVMQKNKIDQVPMQTMLRIKSPEGRTYIAVVTSGPFAEPDGMRADAPTLVISAIHEGIFMPNYHGRVQIEILGEETESGLTPPRYRPSPNSPVYLVEDQEMMKLLGSHGTIRLGLATGHDNVEVCVPHDDKSVLPRHIGILGTTGGGKTTTVSNLIAELQRANAAVVLFDTEGEYTTINEPTSDISMRQARIDRGLRTTGVDNTTVYHLVGREPANPAHPDLRTFGLRFSSLSPWAVKEIVDLSDPQENRFMDAYDVTKLAMHRLGIFPRRNNQDDEAEAIEVDELESGWPRMTLQHLLYIASGMANRAAKTDEKPYHRYMPAEFDNDWTIIKQLIAQADPKNQISWKALLARLHRLNRLLIFDQPNVTEPDYSTMLSPGHVTIIDLSDLDSPAIRNLAIAQVLRGLQRQQDDNYKILSANDEDRLTLGMVLIEEAHEFLSAERVRQMPILFQQVARIARRGRKRWLGLGFITQLPQHLPDEVFGLINSWILHKIQDVNVVNRLRKVIPGVNENMWLSLPAQPPGQAIVSFSHLKRPVTVSMDASPCELRMVD